MGISRNMECSHFMPNIGILGRVWISDMLLAGVGISVLLISWKPIQKYLLDDPRYDVYQLWLFTSRDMG